MAAPTPDGSLLEGPTSARPGSGRSLQRGVRAVFVVVFVVTAAAIVGNATLERAGLRAADAAMYEAKRAGDGLVRLAEGDSASGD